LLEYGAALRYLDELLRRLKPAELQAVDSLIRERAEFGIYSNIAKRLQTASSSLIPVSTSSQSNRENRGLAWVMALARVEVGGVLATFTGHPSPFESVAPSEFEMSAYRQLLLDGAQSHYWALANDPEVRRVAKIEPNTQTLAYIRRLNVARHFLFAAIRSQTESLTPTQLAEAMSQKEQLEKLHRLYSQNVAEYMLVMNSSRKATTKALVNNVTIQKCSIHLQCGPQALASGKAPVKVRDNP
jgi:hypothetical protein